jgi:glutathione S-transferase
MSACVALIEKGQPFTVKTLNLSTGEQDAAQYLSLSLTGRVLTLVHGDFALAESTAICEYLDEVFETRTVLYPRAPLHAPAHASTSRISGSGLRQDSG